jgi:hypothetical protein
MFEEERERW